jgi:GntR family transcriptional regulator/MocR family aminotransferase
MKHAPSGIVPVIAVERAATMPLYRQIYDGYREAIVERRLCAGQRLPSTRQLAAELRVSRMPVLIAFEQLLAEGYFESRVGAGTFVARSLPGERLERDARAAALEPARRATRPARSDRHVRPAGPARRSVSARSEAVLRPETEPWLRGWGAFRVSQPAVDHFPQQAWSRLVARHSRGASANLLNYGSPMGHEPFREAVAGYLRTARAVRCEEHQIMAVSGSQQALELAARVLLDPGCPVWVEEPGYGGAREALAMAGARLVPVPVDDQGLDVAAGVARSPRARAAYVTPSHQYPLGMTMSASRRLQLLEWARESGAWVLEDDYDSEYRYESLPVAALQGLDRDGRVIYIGTFSKVLFPALRLGYLVIPADLVARFAAVREAMDIFPPTLYQAVLADFITEGHFARHLRKMRQLYRERRDALVAAIDGDLGDELRVRDGQAGMHLVATLRQRGHGVGDRRLAAQAARQGLWTMPLSSCYLGAAAEQGLVLGYGGTSAGEIREGICRLRGVLGAG